MSVGRNIIGLAKLREHVDAGQVKLEYVFPKPE